MKMLHLQQEIDDYSLTLRAYDRPPEEAAGIAQLQGRHQMHPLVLRFLCVKKKIAKWLFNKCIITTQNIII